MNRRGGHRRVGSGGCRPRRWHVFKWCAAADIGAPSQRADEGGLDVRRVEQGHVGGGVGLGSLDGGSPVRGNGSDGAPAGKWRCSPRPRRRLSAASATAQQRRTHGVWQGLPTPACGAGHWVGADGKAAPNIVTQAGSAVGVATAITATGCLPPWCYDLEANATGGGRRGGSRRYSRVDPVCCHTRRQ